MLAPTIEEIKGTFADSPFAELLIEVTQSRLSGSFRLANNEEKAVFYIKDGEIVFAVSNLRQHRLFEMILPLEKVSKDELVAIPNFTNDFELARTLVAKGILTKEEVDTLFSQQIERILLNALVWTTGEWSFSHLARAKDGLQFKVNSSSILLNFARRLPDEFIFKRFRSFEEKFVPLKTLNVDVNLSPQEFFLFSRIEGTMRVQDIRMLGGLTEAEMLKTLYVLWSGGLLARKDWNSAFSDLKVKEILAAKLTLKKEAINLIPEQGGGNPSNVPETINEATGAATNLTENDEQKQLQDYLKRVENAESYYEILDVSIKAPVSEIKSAYFNFAKQYHPDRYHQDGDKLLQQKVQDAFTEIARAYETLKDEKSRELYDFKLRKYLETLKDQESSASKIPDQTDNARAEFDQGFAHLMDENYDQALPHLTRAAQMSPETARYRAYFGKVLANSENQRHKAESEIQAAIKLEGENPSYRIMLVEFFIQYKLYKRAEGELQRILNTFPGNKEAETLLESLRGN